VGVVVVGTCCPASELLSVGQRPHPGGVRRRRASEALKLTGCHRCSAGVRQSHPPHHVSCGHSCRGAFVGTVKGAARCAGGLAPVLWDRQVPAASTRQGAATQYR